MTYLIDIATDLIESVITLLVILDPIGVMPFFQGLTASATADQKKAIAKRAIIVASAVLLVFAYLGNAILTTLHVTVNSVMIAGGLFLLVFAVRDVMSHESALRNGGQAGPLSAEAADSIAVFPIAIPLLAGPGAIATVIVLNDPRYGAAKGITDFSTALAILIACIIVWLLFAVGNRLTRIVKPSAMMVIGKVMNILTGAIGVSYIVAGIVAILGH
jgi:multiple antibiotic resistance protein